MRYSATFFICLLNISFLFAQFTKKGLPKDLLNGKTYVVIVLDQKEIHEKISNQKSENFGSKWIETIHETCSQLGINDVAYYLTTDGKADLMDLYEKTKNKPYDYCIYVRYNCSVVNTELSEVYNITISPITATNTRFYYESGQNLQEVLKQLSKEVSKLKKFNQPQYNVTPNILMNEFIGESKFIDLNTIDLKRKLTKLLRTDGKILITRGKLMPIPEKEPKGILERYQHKYIREYNDPVIKGDESVKEALAESQFEYKILDSLDIKIKTNPNSFILLSGSIVFRNPGNEMDIPKYYSYYYFKNYSTNTIYYLNYHYKANNSLKEFLTELKK